MKLDIYFWIVCMIKWIDNLLFWGDNDNELIYKKPYGSKIKPNVIDNVLVLFKKF